MKKLTVLSVTFLVTANFTLSSCNMPIFEGRSYIQGQHASKTGAKAQARVNKQTKHFWF